MTIQQVITILQEEKMNHIPSRFHCRAIMVRDIGQYIKLLEELKKINDVKVISIDEIVTDADVMPNYEILTDKKYQDEWLILPGVSEYLRLFHTSEESAQRFGSLWHYQFDAHSTGRILIPMWGCETLWYDTSLHLASDIRQKEYFYDCSGSVGDAQKLSIQVLSGEFEQYLYQLTTSNGTLFCGLKEWYEFWYDPQLDMIDQLILTKRFRSVKPIDGDIRIHVVRDTLSFIRENLLDGNKLNAENCPKEAQDCLFESAINGKSVDEAIVSALNIHEFHTIDVMGKWIAMTNGQKQLVYLWYMLHPDDSYLCHCMGLDVDLERLSDNILTAIFPARLSHPEWVEESQALIAAIPIQKSDEYYDELDRIPSLEERLDYLTSNTSQERKYILNITGRWLKEDPEATLENERLKELYPSLMAYLQDVYPDEELNAYFKRYKTYKLSNTLPQDQDIYFAGIKSDSYDFRYPVLSDKADDDTFIIWIDALGVEWMPLLKWALENKCTGKVESARVTQAQLPSETCFNEQWKKMELPYEKYDRLDKLAHKGVIDDKDYYACIEEQIRFVAGVAEITDKRLKQYHRVIITGDHGTSRLAARFFHKIKGITAPAKSEVGSHGRFCKTEDFTQIMNTQKTAKDSQNNSYIVFANYDHFTKSGFAGGIDDDTPTYGEIHGGASPEEMLVPVIVVDSNSEIPLVAKWTMSGNSVKVMNKRAKCRIKFSKPVTSVRAQMDGKEGECTSVTLPSKEWTITFSGMKLDKEKVFNISILADDILVNVEPLTIKPALGGGDPF